MGNPEARMWSRKQTSECAKTRATFCAAPRLEHWEILSLSLESTKILEPMPNPWLINGSSKPAQWDVRTFRDHVSVKMVPPVATWLSFPHWTTSIYLTWVLLWMVAKSCTTLDGWNPINNGMFTTYQLVQQFAFIARQIVASEGLQGLDDQKGPPFWGQMGHSTNQHGDGVGWRYSQYIII